MKNRYSRFLAMPLERLYRRAYTVDRVHSWTPNHNTARRCEFVLITLRGIIRQRLEQS